MSPILLSVLVLSFAFINLTFSKQRCPLGTIEENASCIECPPGTYRSDPDSNICDKCEPGTFNAFSGAQGSDSCRRCSPNTFSSESRSSCTKCPPGMLSEEFSPRCLMCGPGFEVTFRSCTICTKGTYGDKQSNLDCTRCRNGKTTLSKGAKSVSACLPTPTPTCVKEGKACEYCSPGEFYSLRKYFCTPCPEGTFSKGGEITKCTPCPPNTWSAGFTPDCEPCPQGTSTTQEGNVICKIDNFPCPSNYFVDKRGRCKSCRRGFRLNRAYKICVSCPKNEWSRGGAATKCFRCGKGKTLVPHLNDCLCDMGTFPTAGGGCQKCPPGTKRGEAGSSSVCERCYRGSISTKSGSTKCKICPRNQFQPKSGQTKCLRCPKGTIQKPFSFGSVCVSTKTNCPIGFKRRQINQDSFKCDQRPCPPGTFEEEDTGNGLKCSTCFPGQRYDLSTGKCVQCGMREFSSGGLVTSCTLCPNGLYRYNPEGDNCRCFNLGYGLQDGVCKKCPPGFFSVFYTEFCRPCPLGTFAKRSGTYSSCKRCPKGTFADKPGSSVCKRCPPGSTSYGTEEASCVRPVPTS